MWCPFESCFYRLHFVFLSMYNSSIFPYLSNNFWLKIGHCRYYIAALGILLFLWGYLVHSFLKLNFGCHNTIIFWGIQHRDWTFIFITNCYYNKYSHLCYIIITILLTIFSILLPLPSWLIYFTTLNLLHLFYLSLYFLLLATASLFSEFMSLFLGCLLVYLHVWLIAFGFYT